MSDLHWRRAQQPYSSCDDAPERLQEQLAGGDGARLCRGRDAAGRLLHEDRRGFFPPALRFRNRARADHAGPVALRSEEHTSELQSLMRISYAVFCLKKKKTEQHELKNNNNNNRQHTL